MKKIIFINSHPIQYFAPLYQYLNKQGLDVSCWYCSDENVKGHLDREFGREVAWDIPLLDGYAYQFFKNWSWKPSLYNGFFGLFNPGLIIALLKEPKGLVIVHGWAYFTNLLVIIFSRLAGHQVCLRGESPLNQDLLKGKRSRRIKKILFRIFLLPFVHKYLYIGTENKKFYTFYGVPESKLVFAPYAVDNDRFHQAAETLAPQKAKLREQKGLPVNSKIILFTGKFLPKKRPMDLLQAFDSLPVSNKCLVMVGDGDLRQQMQTFIEERKLENVFLPGFSNQSDIVNYYALADVFVMCSGEGETWGLSVNEALNFHLPIVVSDMAGCSADLVAPGKNGFISSTGNVSDLSSKLELALELMEQGEEKMLDIYSYKTIGDSLRELV